MERFYTMVVIALAYSSGVAGSVVDTVPQATQEFFNLTALVFGGLGAFISLILEVRKGGFQLTDILSAIGGWAIAITLTEPILLLFDIPPTEVKFNSFIMVLSFMIGVYSIYVGSTILTAIEDAKLWELFKELASKVIDAFSFKGK